MMGLGWGEMAIIAVVALIVVGPQDLPRLLRQAGRFMASMRKMSDDFKAEINKVARMDEVVDIRKSLTEPFRETARGLKDTTDDITRDFNRVTDDGVEPTGLIRPSDPAVESVVDEIRGSAGLDGADAPIELDPAGESMTSAAADLPEMAPVKRKQSPAKGRAPKTAAAKVDNPKAASARASKARASATKSAAARPTAAKSKTSKVAAARSAGPESPNSEPAKTPSSKTPSSRAKSAPSTAGSTKAGKSIGGNGLDKSGASNTKSRPRKASAGTAPSAGKKATSGAGPDAKADSSPAT